MKLRVLRKKIYVSASAQKGWKAQTIEREKDTLQQWDDKLGWTDVPISVEQLNVYSNEFDMVSY